MNHGKINKDQSDSLSTLDKLNRRLAWLLGKREHKSSEKPGQPTSDRKFLLIVIAMVLFLWLLTGVYYVPQKNYGLILHDGNLVKITNGFVIGIDYPYPFAEVILLENERVSLSIGRNNLENDLMIISNDNQQLGLSADIAYHIDNPRQYFLQHYQENSNLDLIVKSLLQSAIQSYVVRQNSTSLLHASTIVTANEIRAQSSDLISNYGLKIDKLVITRLVTKTENNESSSQINQQGSLATAIINQAHLYAQNKAKETSMSVAQFNQLLPQYLNNPQVITQLMYYKMLSSVPAPESSVNMYPLLNLNHAQLETGLWGKGTVSQSDAESDVRMLNRSVDRERVFKGR